MRSTIVTGLAGSAFAIVALAGCSSGSSSTAAAAPTAVTAAPTTAAPVATTAAAASQALSTASSALGTIVVNGNGLTAYYFDYDKPNAGVSACKGSCLQAWPPITTTSASPTVQGVTGKVATIADPSGGNQITIDGRPIYTFAQDTKPGDLNGQGAQGVWHVIAATGKELKAKN